ncbi:MAG: HAMP domain-containing protein [Proteobacteria bacterium]|nr:HAMP domain-containing protein [Pseudomonadota bacterium]
MDDAVTDGGWRRFLPTSLSSQLALSAVALLAFVQIVSVTILVATRPPSLPVFDSEWLAGRLASLARDAGTHPADARLAWLGSQAEAHWFDFRLERGRPPASEGGHSERASRIESAIRAISGADIGSIAVTIDPPPPRAFGGPPRIEPVPGPIATDLAVARPIRFFVADLELADGQWLRVMPKRPGFLGPELSFAAMWLGLFLLAAGIAALWAVKRLAAPLAAIANAAERFGRGDESAPLPAGGAREVRAIARAFAAMRERVSRFVHDRTTMLAAISHDLRTPLTCMRMRVERVADRDLRDALGRDLDALDSILGETLDFARVESSVGTRDRIDLSSLLSTIVDSRADAGQDVVLSGDARPIVSGSSSALRRAIENLVDNALKYGKSADIRIDRQDGHVAVRIADRGPGIADADLETVFRPFHRLESSRNRDTGGTGLGLAIARTLVRAHGGDVILSNRPDGGLLAMLTLPAT